MDVKDYCSSLEAELTGWKTKLNDITKKLDKLGTADRQHILPNIEDLHIFIADLESRVEELKTECPTEWQPRKKELDDAHIDVRSKYEETMKAIGKAAPVSIPG